MAQQAGMIFVTFIVSISGCHSLKIDDVAPLIGSSDTFDFYATSDLYFISMAVDEFIDLNVHLFADLFHHLVELRIRLNSFLLIDGSIFSQTCKFTVV